MSGLLLPLTLVLAFLAVAMIAQTVVGAAVSRAASTRKVNLRLTMIQSGRDPREVYDSLVRKRAETPWGETLPGRLYRRFEVFCGQAGVQQTPLRLLRVLGVVALVLWGVSLALMRKVAWEHPLPNAMMALFAAVLLSSVGGFVYISHRRAARLKKLEHQLPIALDVVIRGLKAGHPVISAVQLVTQEMGDPIGTEFGLIVDEATYGLEFREALMNFARRTGSEDAFFFAVSVGIQAETGGNLAEILDNLATVIRGRASLAKRVKALSSEGKASAWVLSLLPAFCIGSVMMSAPDYYTAHLSDPVFWPIVAGVTGLYLLGLLLIRQIINIKY
jgi:tight adherence protein B